MSFRASEFEFRNRFWIIASIYGVTFALYALAAHRHQRFACVPVGSAANQ